MSPWLRLYPRAWRERYGAELAELIAREPSTLRLWLDLLAGAIDAHTNPQWTYNAPPQPRPNSTAPVEGEPEPMNALFRSCGRTTYPSEDQRKSARIMLASSLGLVALYFALIAALGKTPATEALLFSAFNIAFVLAGLPTFLKNYRPKVRATLVILGVTASYTFFFGVVLLADRI